MWSEFQTLLDLDEQLETPYLRALSDKLWEDPTSILEKVQRFEYVFKKVLSKPKSDKFKEAWFKALEDLVIEPDWIQEQKANHPHDPIPERDHWLNYIRPKERAISDYFLRLGNLGDVGDPWMENLYKQGLFVISFSGKVENLFSRFCSKKHWTDANINKWVNRLFDDWSKIGERYGEAHIPQGAWSIWRRMDLPSQASWLTTETWIDVVQKSGSGALTRDTFLCWLASCVKEEPTLAIERIHKHLHQAAHTNPEVFSLNTNEPLGVRSLIGATLEVIWRGREAISDEHREQLISLMLQDLMGKNEDVVRAMREHHLEGRTHEASMEPLFIQKKAINHAMMRCILELPWPSIEECPWVKAWTFLDEEVGGEEAFSRSLRDMLLSEDRVTLAQSRSPWVWWPWFKNRVNVREANDDTLVNKEFMALFDTEAKSLKPGWRSQPLWQQAAVDFVSSFTLEEIDQCAVCWEYVDGAGVWFGSAPSTRLEPAYSETWRLYEGLKERWCVQFDLDDLASKTKLVKNMNGLASDLGLQSFEVELEMKKSQRNSQAMERAWEESSSFSPALTKPRSRF